MVQLLLARIILIVSKLCRHYQLYFFYRVSSSSRVPQGSVLDPVIFILYTTPLSSHISDSSVGHHLYADDTQLFISFVTSEFSTNIVHLQTTIDLVSQWMSSNLLSLNQSKTEFLLFSILFLNLFVTFRRCKTLFTIVPLALSPHLSFTQNLPLPLSQLGQLQLIILNSIP